MTMGDQYNSLCEALGSSPQKYLEVEQLTHCQPRLLSLCLRDISLYRPSRDPHLPRSGQIQIPDVPQVGGGC